MLIRYYCLVDPLLLSILSVTTVLLIRYYCLVDPLLLSGRSVTTLRSIRYYCLVDPLLLTTVLSCRPVTALTTPTPTLFMSAMAEDVYRLEVARTKLFATSNIPLSVSGSIRTSFMLSRVAPSVGWVGLGWCGAVELS